MGNSQAKLEGASSLTSAVAKVGNPENDAPTGQQSSSKSSIQQDPVLPLGTSGPDPNHDGNSSAQQRSCSTQDFFNLEAFQLERQDDEGSKVNGQEASFKFDPQMQEQHDGADDGQEVYEFGLALQRSWSDKSIFELSGSRSLTPIHGPVLEKDKNNISVRCVSSVCGYVRESGILVPVEIVDMILFFYAMPITVWAQYEPYAYDDSLELTISTRRRESKCKIINCLYCPVYDSWFSLQFKLKQSIQSMCDLEIHSKGCQIKSQSAWDAVIRKITNDGPLLLQICGEFEEEAFNVPESPSFVDSLELYKILMS